MPKPPSRRSRKAALRHVLDRGRLVLAPRARVLLKSGFDMIGDALRPTLGPTARTVLIERLNRNEAPELMDDGATLARRIVELPLYRNTGGMLMRHVAWRVLDQVGDGTATAAVIAQALVQETNRYIASGANPAILRDGIERGLVESLEALDQHVLPMNGVEHLRQIALAAGHDEDVADIIVKIHQEHGLGITICTQEWMARELSYEVADGCKWNSGFAHSDFITDKEHNLAWSEKPYLLFTNVFVDTAEQIVPIMQQVAMMGGREFVLIAPKIEDTALATLLVNNQRGNLHSLAIKAPGEGVHRVGVLQDLAAKTSGRFLSADAGDRVEFATVEDLGECDLVWASRDFFSVIGGEGDPDEIEKQVQSIRGELENEDAPFNRENLRKRLAQLTGGLATLNVGAATKTEMVERRARADRAIKAVEAARSEGVVPGGGVALAALAKSLRANDPCHELDERLGRLALARAMEEPLRVIAENAGAHAPSVVATVQSDGGFLGYDAVRHEFVDMREAGILDPVNVVRAALRNAVSAAVMLMLTEALVIPKYRYLHADPKP
jgi:chaperonin GroEL